VPRGPTCPAAGRPRPQLWRAAVRRHGQPDKSIDRRSCDITYDYDGLESRTRIAINEVSYLGSLVVC